jgi:integrase
VIAQWLGHADVATTERYLANQRADDELTAVVPRAVAVLAHNPRTKRGRS